MVAFTAEGLNLERFLRLCGENELHLVNLKRPEPRRLSAHVAENSLKTLEMIAVSGGWSLVVGKRQGYGGRMLDWLGAQWLMLCAVIMAGVGLIAASQVMWTIQLENAGAYQADIRTFLAESGISAPQWKDRVDTAALRDKLEWRYPELARIDCGFRGMSLVISVSSGIPEGEPFSTAGARDVVALRDGVVDSIVTTAGTPVVKAGDVVRKGQVLIRGEERIAGELTRPVAASGMVTARVWDGAAVRMPTTEVETVYTGREQAVQTVQSPVFDLWSVGEAPYASMDVSVSRQALGGLFVPLVLRQEVRREAQSVIRPRNLDTVKAEAGLAALRCLRQKIGFDSQMLDKWIEYSMIKDGELQAVAVCERVIDIAGRLP